MGEIDARIAAATAVAIAAFIAAATIIPGNRPVVDVPSTPVSPAAPVTVTVQEMAFIPGRIEVPAGRITLQLTNAGSLEHDFSVDALHISPNVRPGETVEVTFDAKPGEYAVYCSLPGHKDAGMAATLAVEP